MGRVQSSPWLNFAAGALTVLALGAVLSVAGVVLADPPTPDAQAPGAAVSRMLHIQGRLTDTGGVPINGSRNLTMTLYNAASGGTVVCRDANNETTMTNGLFEFTMDGCDADEINGQGLWLGVQVGGLPELTPRQEILPVPYAYTVVPGAHIGGSGAGDGSLYFYQGDGSRTIDLTSAGGGDIALRNADGTRTILLNGAPGAIYLGGSGEDGDILVLDTNGVSITFLLDGSAGTVILGGLGESGELYVRDSAGVATFDFEASYGELELGGNGQDGDLKINSSTDVATFTVDGDTGNVTQARTGYGLAKAGVYAVCSTTGSYIIRSFGGAFSIIDGQYPGRCTIDLNFVISDRYTVATAWGFGGGVACQLGDTLTRLDCRRHNASDGSGEDGSIMVLIY